MDSTELSDFLVSGGLPVKKGPFPDRYFVDLIEVPGTRSIRIYYKGEEGVKKPRHLAEQFGFHADGYQKYLERDR